MNCPKRPETVLRQTLTNTLSELMRTGRDELRPEEFSPDTEGHIAPPLQFSPTSKADLIVKNALLDNFQIVDIAVSKNIITRVGTPEEVAEVTTENTIILDAQGNSVTPGFVDSHLHLDVAMQRIGTLNVEDVQTAADFNNRLIAHAQKNNDADILYVFGLHYFDVPIIPAATCRQTLDQIVSNKPVVVFAHDMHTAWGNTKAIEQADLLHPMPPYPHMIEELDLQQKIVIDADGFPTGEFREPEVYYFLDGPLQAKYPHSITQQLNDLETVCNQLASKGITGVHRMSLAQPAEDISFLLLLLELEQQKRLSIRVNSSFSVVDDHNMLKDIITGHSARCLLTKARNQKITAEQLHEELLELLKATGADRQGQPEKKLTAIKPETKQTSIDKIEKASAHIRDTVHGKHIAPHLQRENPHASGDMPRHLGQHAKIRLDTLKIFMDGVIEKDTAYLLDKKPSPGIPEFKQTHLNALLILADKLGMQVAAHSIGNGSVRAMLDAISAARISNSAVDAKRGHKIPHRIEHIETCSPEDIPRFGKEFVIASMQPLHERPPMTMWHTKIPKNEWDTAFAWKGTLENGATLVFGSDWPIVSCDVPTAIHHAINREPWYNGAKKQSVTLSEAMAAYTTGPAFTEYSQNIKGSIKPGMLADFVIFSGKISVLEKRECKLPIAVTICDGQITYKK
jgi:predicted amidohydrolase YtcJ